MKKFILALLIALTFAVPACAANSDDIYVRKDAFDVHLLSINQKLENILSELKAQRNDIYELTKVTTVLSARIDRLDARIDGTNTRIDDLRNGLYLWLVVIGTFIAWPKAKNFIQNIQNKRGAQKQSFTLDDVEKLIDARINSKFHS